jgi:amino acid transporter
VRISFSMALDSEMPDLLSVLHPKYATPYYTVIILSLVSAIIGSIGILGGLPALIGVILASNLGAFLLYAILGVLTVAAFAGTEAFHWLRHGLLPVVGIILNLALASLALIYGLSAGGVIAQGCLVALSLAGLWLLVNIIYYFVRR